MTESHLDQRPLLRAGLAAVVIADLVSFYFFLGDARASAFTNSLALNDLSDLLSRPAVRGTIVSVGVAGAIAFGLRPGRLWQGMVPVGALILLSTAHAQLFGSPWRHLYYSGLCLSGWLLGLAVSRRHGVPTDESYARVGSIALLGAAYFNAGISKIALGGFDWISGLPIQAVIVAQDGLVADSIVSTYRSWVATTPPIAALFSVLTVGFELAGPLMILGRRIRLCVALGLLAIHANIYVLSPILYWESMVLLLLFGVSADSPGADTMPEPMDPILSHGRMFAATAVLLALCALVAIRHQALRFARAHAAKAASDQASLLPVTGGEPPVPVAASPTPASPPRRVGPFVVGQALTETWVVDALTVTDDRIVVALSGQLGRIRFEVTCHSEQQSPFDLGPAHILYSQHVEFRALEGAGRAVQREVQKAAEGQDICDRLADWCMSAR